MTQEEANYIITYFNRLMTETEHKAQRHARFSMKLEQPENSENLKQYERRKAIYEEKSWLFKDVEVLKLLEDGYDDFEIKTAKRIQREHPNEYVINRCPKCKAVTRTPYAKYCVKCGHSWHYKIAGEFKLLSSFKITNRPYFWLVGELTKGEIQKGYRLDFTRFQLNLIAEIKQIEFALKTTGDIAKEYPALGIELDEQQEILVKKYVNKSHCNIMILKDVI